jgi:hypothetical protein
MGVEIMSEQHENKLEEIERVEYNRVESRVITKRAKYLTYPITDITSQLSSLANECGLEEDMDYYLNGVREAENKLESAFFSCEEVFSNRISSLECELLDMEDKESEYDEG